MAAPFIIPFNFQPTVNPSLKTTSYTVPAGRYARVTDLYGDTAFDTVSNSYDIFLYNQSATSFNLLGNPYHYVNPEGCSYYTFSITFSVSSVLNTVQLATSVWDYENDGSGWVWRSANSSDPIILRAGTGTGTTSHSRKAFAESLVRINLFVGAGTVTCLTRFWIGPKGDMWVRPGTVISGTTYYVQEYNVIS